MRPAAHLCPGQTAGDGGTQSQGVSPVETAQLPEVGSGPAPCHENAGPFVWPRARASSRSHRVLGRTMWSRRSPLRGNPGGFCFDMLANEPAVGAAVLDEDLVGVEPRGEHAGDVDAPDVGLERRRLMARDTRRLVDLDAD